MNSVPQVVVLGRSEASMLLQSDSRDRVQAAISIHGPRDFPCEGLGAVSTFTELIFDDVDAVDESDPVSAYRSRLRKQRAQYMGLSLVPPSKEHVGQIVEFAARVQGIGGMVLCHCDAGISRSPAVAIVCLVCWMGSRHEQEAAKHVLKLRPAAKPHAGIIRLADEHLRLGGRLCQAVESIFGQ